MKTNFKQLVSFSILTLLLSSCGGDKGSNSKTPTEIINTPNDQVWVVGEGQVNGDVNFGELEVGEVKLLSLMIKNNGASSVTSPLQISGDFTIAYQSGCSNLPVNKTCLVKLSFSSKNKTSGPYSGQIQLGEYVGSLSAVVLPQSVVNNLSIKVNSLEVEDSIDFGTLNYKQSIIKTLLLRNNNSEAIQLTSNISGTDFSKVFDNCTGKNLRPQNGCSIKILVSGQGKNGVLESDLTIADKLITLSATVVGRVESVENNSQIVSIVDNKTAVNNETIDLGTINTDSQVSKTFYLKNSGSEQSPLISTSLNGPVSVAVNQCDNIVLNPNQSCRLQALLPTTDKGVKQLSLILSGYQDSKQYDLEYIVRSPGDKIDCTAGLNNVSLAEITWTGSIYTPCQVVTCNPNHHISNNQCDADTVVCSANGGSGTKAWEGNDYGVCSLNSCDLFSDHIVNNTCVPNMQNITVTQPAIGTGTITGPTTVLFGSSATYTYTGTITHQLDVWGSSCSVVNGNSCTINNVTSSKTISLTTKCANNYTLSAGECLRTITLTPASSANYNIYSAASSPTDKVVVNLNINSGVTLYSNSTGVAALTTGSGWMSGSVININNNGSILGMGGNGGRGGSNYSLSTTNTDGSRGGDAIVLNHPVVITNNGSIFSGGGGGGGSTYWDLVNTLSCGGGGGGGQGYGTSAAGGLGACWSGAYYPQGTGGNSGNISGPGAGGNGRNYTTAHGTTVNEAGGNGGAWGQPGANGGRSYAQSNPANFRAGMLGGAPGNAITRNGHTATFITGDDSNKLKGPVQ